MNNPISIILIIVAVIALIVFFAIIKKDPSKTLELIFSALLSLVFFIASICVANSSNTTEPPTSEPTVSISDTESSSHEESSSEASVPQNDSLKSSTEEPTITGNSFSKELSYNDESYTVNFNAPTNGTYRFDYEISDVNCNYKVVLKDSKNEIIFHSEYSTYGNGDTCTLTKNEKYKLTVEQLDGFPIATIKIGVPSESALLQFEN